MRRNANANVGSADVPSAEGDGPSHDVSRLRRSARRRSLVCPGAGFDLLGCRRRAWLTYLASLSVVAAAVWICLTATLLAGVAFLLTLLAASVLSILESRRSRRAGLDARRPGLLSRLLAPAAGLYVLGSLAAVVLFVASFGAIVVHGGGMAPTVASGEWLIFHRRGLPDDFAPDTLIVFRCPSDSQWKPPAGELMIGRIRATPGDRLETAEGFYVVNGRSTDRMGPLGELRPAIDLSSGVSVPQGCYFIVQDGNGFDSLVLSWVRRSDIVSTRVFRLGLSNLLRRVQ